MIIIFINRYDPRNIYDTTKSGHVTCNIWGWMSIHGVGDVGRIEESFNAEKYLEILENFFLPSLRERSFPFPPGPIIFVHDRCPVHMARAVQEWFARQDNLLLLEWPSKGCDCNPIEHLWANMVNAWEPENERTADQLMNHVRTQWELFRGKPHLIEKLVASMPRRLQEVAERGGGWTHY